MTTADAKKVATVIASLDHGSDAAARHLADLLPEFDWPTLVLNAPSLYDDPPLEEL